jgi:hypothetical protein
LGDKKLMFKEIPGIGYDIKYRVVGEGMFGKNE